MIIRPKTTAEVVPIPTYLEKLAAELDTSVKDNTIIIPQTTGTGLIKNIFFEEEFCIRYFNLCFNTDTKFEWCIDNEPGDITYKLVFTLCGTDASCCTETSDPKSLTENSTVLYSLDSIRPFVIPAHTNLERLVFLFTAEWLKTNFSEAHTKLQENVLSLTRRNRPAIISETMGTDFYTVIRELTEDMNNKDAHIIHIKTKSLMILSNFLDKEVCRVVARRQTEPISLYHDDIIAVEKRLRGYLLSSMPSIADLAHDHNMSASTLQRHFKIVFGKNIYQYYLELKLNMGKEMIASKKKSISEVAYMLGYNKINSFSKLFKKNFGVLPKDIKRSRKK
ncbi:MAG: AraC family transcriptional regulator [Ferruginibacter sp.]